MDNKTQPETSPASPRRIGRPPSRLDQVIEYFATFQGRLAQTTRTEYHLRTEKLSCHPSPVFVREATELAGQSMANMSNLKDKLAEDMSEDVVDNPPRQIVAAARRKYSGRGRKPIISPPHLESISRLVEATEGSITLKELKSAMELSYPELSGVSVTSLWRAMRRRLRLSYKLSKNSNCSRQTAHNEEWCRRYLHQVAEKITERKIIGSIDETSLSTTLTSRRRWSMIGKPRVFDTKTVRNNWTLLCVAFHTGLVVGQVVCGSVTADIFEKFSTMVRGLFPPNVAYLLADNASCHRAPGSRELPGVIYNSPYRPELNPIEGVFSQLKAHLRRHNSAMNPAEISAKVGEFFRSFDAINMLPHFCHSLRARTEF